MGAIMWRVVKSFFLHVVLMLVALGLIWLVVQGQDALSAAVRLRYQGRSAQALMTVLEDERGRLMMWCFIAFLVSWLASSVFLAASERARPAGEIEARSKIGLWSLMLVVTIAFLMFSAWLNLIESGVSTSLASATFLTAVLIGGVSTVLAYYFATALMVRRVMRPSVPLATALPTTWS
ncbi:MAG TPA: hypothetical protein VEW25_14350 [Allosphingosinicella sp.]|nr:hypothetical protein [Allosphingosinicella sp.]